MATPMSDPQGPGPLASVHRFTIAAALVCFLGYGGWEFFRAREGYIGRGVGAFVAAFATAMYLRTLGARLDKKLTPRQPTDG